MKLSKKTKKILVVYVAFVLMLNFGLHPFMPER